MRKLLAVIALSGILISGVAGAAEDQKAKQEIGEWWSRSALSYDPLLEQWLFHAEATVAYQKLSGNTEGKIYSTSPIVTVRKGRFTNYLGYSLAAQDVNYGGNGAVNTRTETISEDLRCEIRDWLFLGAGYRNTKDDLTYIDNRDTYFGGAGLSYSPIKDRLTMGLFVAYGVEDTAYLAATQASDEDSGGIYLKPSVQVRLTKTVSLTAQGTYLEYTKDEMGKRWDVDVGFDVALAPYVYLNLGFNEKYENNIAIRSNPEAENTTRTQMVGLKFSY